MGPERGIPIVSRNKGICIELQKAARAFCSVMPADEEDYCRSFSSSLAAEVDEDGFWPVTSLPSTTVKSAQTSAFS